MFNKIITVLSVLAAALSLLLMVTLGGSPLFALLIFSILLAIFTE